MKLTEEVRTMLEMRPQDLRIHVGGMALDDLRRILRRAVALDEIDQKCAGLISRQDGV